MSTLFLRNNIQLVLWECEISGQISDGMWENTRPLDHWKNWCNATVVVADSSEQLGRNFWAKKDNYDLTNRDLLDTIGTRMLGYLRLARTHLGPQFAIDFSEFVDWSDGTLNTFDLGSTDDYEARKAGKFLDLCVKYQVPSDGSFHREILGDQCFGSMKDLKAELRDMKQIMRTISRSSDRTNT